MNTFCMVEMVVAFLLHHSISNMSTINQLLRTVEPKYVGMKYNLLSFITDQGHGF